MRSCIYIYIVKKVFLNQDLLRCFVNRRLAFKKIVSKK